MQAAPWPTSGVPVVAAEGILLLLMCQQRHSRESSAPATHTALGRQQGSRVRPQIRIVRARLREREPWTRWRARLRERARLLGSGCQRVWRVPGCASFGRRLEGWVVSSRQNGCRMQRCGLQWALLQASGLQPAG